ncbi:hypothetical protein MMC07_008626 [Pseudocyphellaria aurata]|nr:hypothetical protein [Pseudocyphellaria aurata]
MIWCSSLTGHSPFRSHKTENLAKTLIHVSLAEVELNPSGYDEREHQFAKQDEAISCTQRWQPNRPNVCSTSSLSQKPNRRSPRAAHRSSLSESNQRKPRGNFPQEKVQILQSWLKNHDWPYPDKAETGTLASLAGLTTVQVQAWFTRYRKKLGPTPNLTKSMPISHEQLGHLPENWTTQVLADADGFTASREPSASVMEGVIPCASLHENRDESSSPLEDYLNASPWRVPWTAVGLRNDSPSFSIYKHDHSTVRPQSNLPTTEGESGRTNQFSSQQSGPSVLSNDTAGRLKGKKGRRIVPPRPAARERQGNEMFQCTTCSRGFRYQSDWARHEAVHDPPEKWICTYGGPRLTIAGERICAFCDEPNPTDEHLNSKHDVSLCFDKPTEERSFSRADGLLRHLKDSHNASIRIPPNSWMVPTYEDGVKQFWCGFCRDYLRTNWNSWCNHKADHFTKDNFDMTRWSSESSLAREFSNESLVFNLAVKPDSVGTLNFGYDSAANPDFDLNFNVTASLDSDDAEMASSYGIEDFNSEYPEPDSPGPQ